MQEQPLARKKAKAYSRTMPVANKQEAPQTSALVLDFLRNHPDESFSPKEIGDAIGLVPGRVSASLQYLHRQHDEVVNEGRGSWCWKTEEQSPPTAPSSVELLAPLAKALGGANHMNSSALPDTIPALFEPVTTHKTGALVLRDANGDLWLAQPIRIEMWPVLSVMGIEPPEDVDGSVR